MVDNAFLVFDGNTSLASIEGEKGFPIKDRGVDRRPTNSEREKLSVARVARNMPRRRSEKDWRSR